MLPVDVNTQGLMRSEQLGNSLPDSKESSLNQSVPMEENPSNSEGLFGKDLSYIVIPENMSWKDFLNINSKLVSPFIPSIPQIIEENFSVCEKEFAEHTCRPMQNREPKYLIQDRSDIHYYHDQRALVAAAGFKVQSVQAAYDRTLLLQAHNLVGDRSL